MPLIHPIEHVELIEKLRNAGHGQIVDAMMNHENYFPTTGRINIAKVARSLDMNAETFRSRLAELREEIPEFE